MLLLFKLLLTKFVIKEMINNKFINTTRSISFNYKTKKFYKRNIRPPYIWFFTDVKKTQRPLTTIKVLPKKSGVVIRNYSHAEQINIREIKKYRHSRILTILAAGKYTKHNYIDGVHYPRWLQSYNIKNNVIKSISVHGGKDIRKSINLKANLVFIAPIFKTTSHKEQNCLGVIKLGLLAKLYKVPVIALGGINEHNVSRLKGLPILGCAGIDVFIK